MKIVFSSASMLHQLMVASRAQGRKNSMPILDCFLLELAEGGDSLMITASDMENTLVTRCALSDSEAGDTLPYRICVNARLFADSLKGLPEQPVSLTVDESTKEIRGEYLSGRFFIMGQDSTTFPESPSLKGEIRHISLSSSVLCASIETTLFATASDEIRLAMTGVFFDVHDGTVTFVGTNGRTLARRVARIEGQQDFSFILPKKSAAVLKSLLDRKSDEPVEVFFDGNLVSFQTRGFTLTSRRIEANYPRYNAVIPSEATVRSSVAYEDLLPSLRRIQNLSDKDTGMIKFTFGDRSLVLEGMDKTVKTKAKEDVACVTSGGGMSVCMSGPIVVEALKNIASEMLEVDLTGPAHPVVFRPAGQEEGDDTLILIMPLKME